MKNVKILIQKLLEIENELNNIDPNIIIHAIDDMEKTKQIGYSSLLQIIYEGAYNDKLLNEFENDSRKGE